MLIKFRWLFFILSLALVGISLTGFKHFIFDASPRIYFAEDNKAYENYLGMEDTYGRDFKLFIMVSSTQGDLFQKQQLQAILELTEAAWQIPFARRVNSITNFQYTQSIDDDLEVNDFISAQMLDDAELLAARKQYAITDPDLKGRIITENAQHTAVLIDLSLTGEQAQGETAKDIVGKAYQLEEKIKQKFPSVDIAMTGNLMSTYHNTTVAENDLSIMIPVMFGLMFIFLGILFRSGSSVFVSFFIASFSALAALGFAAFLGIEFSVLALNAVIISITVAVAHCIHIFSQFFHELKTQPKMQALESSLNVNFFAVSMTSLTTIIGFLSLNANNLPPAVSLGNAAALGTALAWLFALTILPALVSILPFKNKNQDQFLIEKYMSRFAEFVIRKKYAIVTVMTLVCVLMVHLSFSNQLNDRLSETLHEPHIFRSDTGAIDKHFGPMYVNNYEMDSGEAQGIANPEYLKHVDAFVSYLRKQPEVSSVYSFVDVIKRMHRSMNGDDPAYYKIPDSRELTAQYILLYEMSVPYGLDLSNQITLDKRKTLVVVSSPSLDTATNIDIDKTTAAWLKNNMPPHLQTDNISLSTIWAYLTVSSLKDSLMGAVMALVLISAVLLIMLRSIRYGIISLIPNIMPAAFGFGLWFLYSGNVGLGLTCVMIITIGIVVDDTVHFLAKYKKALEENRGNAEEAIRATFKQVGPALLITTLVLCSGFLVLAFSNIIINSALGQVTTAILLAAFILDILLLPALLLIIDGKKKNSAEQK